MKTFKNLYNRICSWDNLYQGAAKARRHKTRKGYVEDFGLRQDREIRELRESLLNGSYQPAGYRQFRVSSGVIALSVRTCRSIGGTGLPMVCDERTHPFVQRRMNPAEDEAAARGW